MGELPPLFDFVHTHAPRAASSFSWTAGCQLEKEKENKILGPFEITYSSPRILRRLPLISDSKGSNGPLCCFRPLTPIALGAPSAANLLVSPLTPPPDEAGVFAQMSSCLAGLSSYPTWRRILNTLSVTRNGRLRSSAP